MTTQTANRKRSNKQGLSTGYTLVELAVVMLIVSLLIGGMLLPIAAQQDVRARLETDKALSDIREALIGFAIINGRLPCPADRSIATGAANAGVEQTTGTGAALTCACATVSTTSRVAKEGTTVCSQTSAAPIIGIVPWATLGLTETNPWGQRYTYAVSASFSRGVITTPAITDTWGTGCAFTAVSDMPTKSAFALCTQGDMEVKTAATSGTLLASGLAAIVVSHGKTEAKPTDGTSAGAYMPNGFISPDVATGDEGENFDGDKTFVSNTSLNDQLIWVPTNTLMVRMLAALKLP